MIEPDANPTTPVVHDYRAPTMPLGEALQLEELTERRTILRSKLLAIATRLNKRPSWQMEAVLFEMAARQLDFTPTSTATMLCELINMRNWSVGAYRRNPDRIEIVELKDLINDADADFCEFMRTVFARCS